MFGCAAFRSFLPNIQFELDAVVLSSRPRKGPAQWLSELVATFGLILTIEGVGRARPRAVPAAVALWITAAYWFTASTSFANPAVTVARCLSATFAGIRPADVGGFIAAQTAGACLGALAARRLFGGRSSEGAES